MNKSLWSAVLAIFMSSTALADGVAVYTPEPKDDYVTIGKLEKRYKNPDTDIASQLPAIRAAAEKGNPQAQYLLAYLSGNALGMDRNFREGLKWYTIAAEQNYPPAQYKLGGYYEQGWATPPNTRNQAMGWFVKSAKAGYAPAQEEVGETYMYGRHKIPPQPKEAMRWLKLSADQGYTPAMTQLGYFYEKSEEFRDFTQALAWYLKAAQLGNATAAHDLATIYRHGYDGVKQDLAEAAKWYIAAAEDEDTTAEFIDQVGIIYAEGTGVPKNEEKAVELFSKSADMGSDYAKLNLATHLASGEGIQKNEEAAFILNRTVAETGNPDAEYAVGEMYFFASGVPKDANQAMLWWHRAAVSNIPAAQNNLGATYFDGVEVKQDYFQAYVWLEAALENGFEHSRQKRDAAKEKLSSDDLNKAQKMVQEILKNPQSGATWFTFKPEEQDAVAEFRFGNTLHEGKEVEKNDEEAVKWWRKAADQNNLSAQVALGRAYEFGEGIAKDPAQATEWYRKAAEQDDGDAQKALGVLYKYGKGVPKDLVQAYFWFELANDHYKNDAVISQGDVAKQMTPEQVEQAREMVRKWKEAKKPKV